MYDSSSSENNGPLVERDSCCLNGLSEFGYPAILQTYSFPFNFSASSRAWLTETCCGHIPKVRKYNCPLILLDQVRDFWPLARTHNCKPLVLLSVRRVRFSGVLMLARNFSVKT